MARWAATAVAGDLHASTSGKKNSVAFALSYTTRLFDRYWGLSYVARSTLLDVRTPPRGAVAVGCLGWMKTR